MYSHIIQVLSRVKVKITPDYTVTNCFNLNLFKMIVNAIIAIATALQKYLVHRTEKFAQSNNLNLDLDLHFEIFIE